MIIAERYEILGKIGTGGMADVYKAKDHKLNRFVAVKVLKQEFREDTTFIRKFRSEAQAAAGLTHPNIVNVFDVGDDDGVYYIVMELIEGITLKEYIAKKGKLSIKEATSIAIQVSMGLEAAHNHGIVHRDVKPQNIIISTDGKVKVTDFGIARAASSNTISSNVMGSVHYSSPEQVRGGYSDEKSDIYSLGITLYEMVTGRVPFDGDTTVAIAIKHLQEEMIPPSVYTPDLPYSLEQIIFKCTQKSVGRRYAKMEDVIADLKHSLIDPSGDFVKLSDVDNEAKTVIISDEELGEIKHTPKARTGQRKTDAAALEEEKIDTKASILSLLKNKYWLMQLLNTVFVYLGLYTRLAVMIYYGLYVLGNPGLVAVLVIADNVPGLIAMPFALAVSNKIGKRKAALGGLLLTMIGFAIMLLNIYNIPVFVAGLVIKGIFFAPVQGSTNAFVADSALYGEWKTGVKSEGMAYSAISFANKASSGLSGVVVGWVLALTGYVGGAATQTPSAVNGIIFLYIGVTLICTIGQIIVFAFYNLDSKMPQIRTELNERD